MAPNKPTIKIPNRLCQTIEVKILRRIIKEIPAIPTAIAGAIAAKNLL
jgi:hypothetical protein